ncbi:uncharacterized protein B0P05DRAFT_559159 [Gilbertella persicaria]|uniref:uncharacterized protein n=1 Tax=Gilbertella persicaria TaxID=101096 RepID=UPI0022210446|nr:uncharacterized protein B0P05DRAFT_559159 [Gilbertella persicaria]KAI8058950.1 hypothetical protein B0P05DRAFT_559159 [Gilbertella persicaria]
MGKHINTSFHSVSILPLAIAEKPDTLLTIAYLPSGEIPSAYTLYCFPTSGTHPNPTGACDIVYAVDGYLEILKQSQPACVPQNNNVSIVVSGTVGGNSFDLRRNYTDDCAARADLGSLIP